jgi:hypothetical protein
MRRLFASRGGSAAAAGLLVLLVAGGGYALAGNRNTLTACVQKGSGTLYIAKCGNGDRKVTWNKVGPVGPAGPRGAAGPPGLTGPKAAPGASTSSYASNNLAQAVQFSQTGGFTTVLSTVINLSSTQTINVTASAQASSLTGPNDNVGCHLALDNNPNPISLDNVTTIPGAGGVTTLANVGSVANVPSGSHTISLDCFQTQGSAGDASVGNDNLLAWTTG